MKKSYSYFAHFIDRHLINRVAGGVLEVTGAGISTCRGTEYGSRSGVLSEEHCVSRSSATPGEILHAELRSQKSSLIDMFGAKSF